MLFNFGKKGAPSEETDTGAALATEELSKVPSEDRYEEDPFEGKDGVEITYNLEGDEVKKGLLILQKEQNFTRNYIYTAILGVLFCLYVFYVIKDPGFTTGYFMMALAAGVIALIWTMMWRYRASQAKAVSQVKEDFNMSVYENGILVHQENGDYKALFTEPRFHVREIDDLFLLDLNRQRVYILPKRRMTGEQIDTLRRYFKNNIIDNEKAAKSKTSSISETAGPEIKEEE